MQYVIKQLKCVRQSLEYLSDYVLSDDKKSEINIKGQIERLNNTIDYLEQVDKTINKKY